MKSRKEMLIFDCIQNFMMCVIISLAMMLLLKASGFWGLIRDIGLSWIINMIFDMIVPVGLIGTKIADKVTRSKLPHYFCQIFVISTLNVTVILIMMLLIKVGPTALFLNLMKKTWPLLAVIAYIGALCCTPVTGVCMKKIIK